MRNTNREFAQGMRTHGIMLPLRFQYITQFNMKGEIYEVQTADKTKDRQKDLSRNSRKDQENQCIT